MPMLRKIIKVGSSRAVIIPAEWLDYYRKQFGKDLVEIRMEINDVITISPVPVSEEKKIAK